MEYQEMSLEDNNNSSLIVRISVDYKWSPQQNYYIANIELELPCNDKGVALHPLLHGKLDETLFSRNRLNSGVGCYREQGTLKARVLFHQMTLTNDPIESDLRVKQFVTSIKIVLNNLVRYNQEKFNRVPSAFKTEITLN